MATDSPYPNGLLWRVQQAERAIEKHDDRLSKVEDEADDIKVLQVKLDVLAEKVRVQTAALWAAAGGFVLIAASLIVTRGGL